MIVAIDIEEGLLIDTTTGRYMFPYLVIHDVSCCIEVYFPAVLVLYCVHLHTSCSVAFVGFNIL